MAENDTLIELKEGDILCANGEDIENIYLIIKGKITAYATYGTFTFGAGAIACLAGGYYGICIYNYVVKEDTIVQRFKFSSISDIVKICNRYRDDYGRFVMVHNHFVMDMIKTYLSLLIKCRKKDSAFSLASSVNKWELDKFNGLAGIPADVASNFYSSNSYVAAAAMAEGARFTTVLNDACLQMAEFLGINMDYIPPEPEPEVVATIHEDANDGYYDEEIIAEMKGSLHKLLSYANLYEEEADEFEGMIKQLKQCSDKLSSDETVRRLRKDISDSFYTIYYKVFMHSLDEDIMPNYVKMFLNFGYMDDELISDKNLVALYKITQTIDDTCNNSHVYTIYNWLKHILWGEKEPSKNSLEQSYEDYMREQSRSGNLDITLDEAMSDSDLKLKYEIENMFQNTHRMTYGRVSSFIPVLIEENIYKPFNNMFMSADAIMNNINNVRSLDFSLFYRSTIYSNEQLGISKEYVYTEVLPDIILMPCVGSYGVMWQEIEGRARNTSARFMLPIFCSGQTDSIIINMLGKFRWELCKRIQGAYWNTVSEKSLTSEYYDYIQFYKKNRELSDAAKSKIRSSLLNARNNYAEVFAKDYEQWITYESKGSSKLNKVSRLIMAKYCPFTSKIRTVLKANPAYTEAFEYYERMRNIQKKRIDNICKILDGKEVTIPREIRETKAYYNR